ncbi:hypothetical protein EMM73_16025 [Rheinheimera sediminis]|uniref:hypothetical protein n=1 Tax=Rheinheimera sp. YQF-1 TaxID=2499626 RepID=UPI000FDB71FC|nr:hypothetical protein [Rheinheimera sp. YQF-1]RVT44639.1 hypothetical protein EMM73_16025 [Rheinheimera sp. YQF-1]
MKPVTYIFLSAAIAISSAYASTASSEVLTISGTEYETDLHKALYQVKERQYSDAFPTLLKYAKYGDKYAQNIVGSYFIEGLGTEENVFEGLVWLGVALEQRESKWKNNYEALTANLTAEQKKAVEQKTEEYKAKYGSQAQFVSCRMQQEKTGSNLRVHRCHKIKDTSDQVKVRVYSEE